MTAYNIIDQRFTQIGLTENNFLKNYKPSEKYVINRKKTSTEIHI